MRGIGRGQTIHLYIVPEIKRLIKKSLPRLTGNIEDDVAAWLIINGMRSEKLQFNLLCDQSTANVWRKRAYRNLLANADVIGTPDCLSYNYECMDVFRERIDFAVENLGNSGPVAGCLVAASNAFYT